MGKLFDIPMVMTTSFETGPNGSLPREFLETYPDAPLIARPGQIDAWDNADFRAAVKATGRKQMIVGGITTDVCKYRSRLAKHADTSCS
jgi:nicotinamidase-related amidase